MRVSPKISFARVTGGAWRRLKATTFSVPVRSATSQSLRLSSTSLPGGFSMSDGMRALSVAVATSRVCSTLTMTKTASIFSLANISR